MRICKKCIQPDTRPAIYFNEEGVCGACIWEEEKKTIDWDVREKKLQEIADWAKKTTTSNYDCVIGVSGGKDSTKQSITARDKLGLHCLLVNSEPEGITDIGRHNIENLKNLGFDVISLRPNPQVMKKLIKRDFLKYLNPQKVTEFTLYFSGYLIADKFNIPLIIQGENASLTLGTRTGLGTGYDAMKITDSHTLSSGWKDYLEVEGIKEKDLFMYHFDRKQLEERDFQAIWLQYFLKEWSFQGNAEFAEKHGFRGRNPDFDPNSIGTYSPYSQLDSDLIQVNQLLKYVKFGFGQCMDHACYHLRENRISREEAFELVRKYDGKCSDEYIKQFCDYIEISVEEFWRVTNEFRGPMWLKDSEGNWKNSYLDIVNQET